MKPHSGLKRFRTETRYPHKRSEGLTVRRGNGGTRALIITDPDSLGNPSEADK